MYLPNIDSLSYAATFIGEQRELCTEIMFIINSYIFSLKISSNLDLCTFFDTATNPNRDRRHN